MNKTFGPYSPIMQAGDFYFVSGQVGVNPDTNSAGQTIEEQTDQVLRNLNNVLETADLSMSDVVKANIYLTDMSDFRAVNDIYTEYFFPPRPARAAVGVKELPKVAGDTKLLIEIEAIAYREGRS